MANDTNDSAVQSGEETRVPADLAAAFKYGPRGALLVSAVSVGLLFAGWLAFYYFVFLPRGPVG
jgi:hypothetical protein